MGWLRRTPRAEKPLRYWQAELARRQALVVEGRVELELVRLKLDVRRRAAGPADFDAIRQLDLHLSALREARREFDLHPARKERRLDRLVLRLWEWSTTGKFEPPEEKEEPEDPIGIC